MKDGNLEIPLTYEELVQTIVNVIFVMANEAGVDPMVVARRIKKETRKAKWNAICQEIEVGAK